jgi:hypothetical protein
MSDGEGGSKKCGKSVTYYLMGPLGICRFYFIDINILIGSDQDLFVALLPSSVDHFRCSLCPGVVPNHPA